VWLRLEMGKLRKVKTCLTSLVDSSRKGGAKQGQLASLAMIVVNVSVNLDILVRRSAFPLMNPGACAGGSSGSAETDVSVFRQRELQVWTQMYVLGLSRPSL